MEAVSNLAGAAHKAVFGSGVGPDEGGSNQEPVSGVQGGGTANDPYDKGNDESTNQDKNAPSDAQPSETTGDPSSAQSGDVGSNRNEGADAPSKDPESETQDFGSKDEKGNMKVPHTDEEREKLMMSGNFPHDPNDHSGEPLKMHSQGRSDDSAADADAEQGGDGEQKKDRKDSVAHEGGDPHGEKKGDGTKLVKASGVAADGGDFDAANPGAGSEANRLLEEKGVHKSAGPNSGDQADDNDNSGSAATDNGGDGKVSKLQKIKDKLHIS